MWWVLINININQVKKDVRFHTFVVAAKQLFTSNSCSVWSNSAADESYNVLSICLNSRKNNVLWGHTLTHSNLSVHRWMSYWWSAVHTVNANVEIFSIGRKTQALSLVHTYSNPHTTEYKRKQWQVFTVRLGPDQQMEAVSQRNPQGRPDSILPFFFFFFVSLSS